MGDANDPVLAWPLDRGEPGREVWYGLVTERDASVAFWYRYTLLSTTGGHREARLWAALTQREGASAFATHAWPLETLTARQDPFALSFGPGELTSASALGTIPAEPGAGWSLTYEPDTYTFTPLRSQHLTRLLARLAGTGQHWSRNQSLLVDGTASVGEASATFEQAPGHQGHTVGTSPPEAWTWMHCNAFETDEPVCLEALDVDGRLSVCLRQGEEVHALDRLAHVLWTNRTRTNEPGDWRFTARGDGVELTAELSVPEGWQRVAYAAGDEQLSYNAHASLADLSLTYRRDGRGKRTLESPAARVEWGRRDPPIPGVYRPDWATLLADPRRAQP